MIHTITIPHSTIHEKVLLISSYQAAKDDVETYDRCRVKQADLELIDTYYEEFLTDFTQLILKYLKDPDCPCCTPEHPDAMFTLEIPDFPYAMTKAADILAVQMCTYYCLVKWYNMLVSKETLTAADASLKALDQYTSDVQKFQHLLNTRSKPIRLKSSVI